MTTQQLRNVQRLLFGQHLSQEERADLCDTISTVLYTQQLKDFKRYVDDSMFTGSNETEAQQAALDRKAGKFYDLTWEVTFNGATVRVENDAVAYNAFSAALDEIIDEL